MNEDLPPDTAWVTAVERTAWDFDGATDPGTWGAYFTKDEYLAGVAAELKSTQKEIRTLYLVTFLGAFIVIGGGIPTNAEVEIVGAKLPLNLFSQQALAVVTAGVFSTYTWKLLSLFVLYRGLSRFLPKYGPSCWEFVLAQYNASDLAGAVLRPKNVGYSSPRREEFLIGVIGLGSLATILIHAGLVVFSSAVALASAARSNDLFAIFLGSVALFSSSLALLGFAAATIVPMPYRWRKVPGS